MWTGVLAAAPPTRAQGNFQLWGDLSLNGSWRANGRGTWALDLEPQAMVAAPESEPDWYSWAMTPGGEYAATSWLDLVGELGSTYTQQTDGLRSFELTPRVGIRFHVLSRDLPTMFRGGRLLPELPPKRRLAVRDLIRIEYRNLFYNGDEPSTSVRLRNRLEFLFPLNRARVTEDGAHILLGDWEWYRPVSDPRERFANRQRIRTGLAFRHTYEWRYELVYVWNRSRDTTDQPFTISDSAFSITVKKFFP